MTIEGLSDEQFKNQKDHGLFIFKKEKDGIVEVEKRSGEFFKCVLSNDFPEKIKAKFKLDDTQFFSDKGYAPISGMSKKSMSARLIFLRKPAKHGPC